jgi:hypothetical protein
MADMKLMVAAEAGMKAIVGNVAPAAEVLIVAMVVGGIMEIVAISMRISVFGAARHIAVTAGVRVSRIGP